MKIKQLCTRTQCNIVEKWELSMNTHTQQLDIKTMSQCEETLQNLVDKELSARYGNNPDPIILERVREEWNAMARTGTLLDMAALYEISLWLKDNGHPYYAQHATGSSFIGYLLGISSANPLPPHFYCPKCQKVQWDFDIADGYDLPKDHICSEDGATLLVDGHNIPWQMLWGYGDYEPWFYIEIVKDAYADLVRYIQQDGRFAQMLAAPQLKEDHFGNKCIFFPQVRIYFSLKPTSGTNDFHSRTVDPHYATDAKSVSLITDSYRFSGKLMAKQFIPKSFGDIVFLDGMASRSNKIDPVEYFMCRHMGYHLTDLMVFPESVYQYLLTHECSPEDAWRGSVQVRRGRGLPYTTREMELARDKWVLSQCARTHYLCCKADILERIFYKLKLSRT